ncbi:hypothetical protein [Mesobacillus boroniphilus]|nr:hypothetical protein [Mesobacillus boroniphilus]
MDRKLVLDKNFKPVPLYIGDETFRIGIFKFNITKILADLANGELIGERTEMDVVHWFKENWRGKVNEDHMPNVMIGVPIVMVEIKPGTYSVIDGNHRLEKAFRDGVEKIDAIRLKGEQILPYFTDGRGYESFIKYWNSKLDGRG